MNLKDAKPKENPQTEFIGGRVSKVTKAKILTIMEHEGIKSLSKLLDLLLCNFITEYETKTKGKAS